jgi:hypothetical protein
VEKRAASLRHNFVNEIFTLKGEGGGCCPKRVREMIATILMMRSAERYGPPTTLSATPEDARTNPNAVGIAAHGA